MEIDGLRGVICCKAADKRLGDTVLFRLRRFLALKGREVTERQTSRGRIARILNRFLQAVCG